jgi:hypothetical protein
MIGDFQQVHGVHVQSTGDIQTNLSSNHKTVGVDTSVQQDNVAWAEPTDKLRLVWEGLDSVCTIAVIPEQ